MIEKIKKILNIPNKKIDSSIINDEQIKGLVTFLLKSIEENVEGDIVEFGCYVGESSKYIMTTIIETNSKKNFYVYDSFNGLPELTKWEKNTGWKSGTLKTTEDIFINNFKQNNLPIPIIHKDWFCDIPEYKLPERICFAFLDGDFYNSIYDSLVKIYDRVSYGGYIVFHDYKRNDLPGVEAAIKDFFNERNLKFEVSEYTEQLGVYKKLYDYDIEDSNFFVGSNKNVISFVTGLWDLGRENLTEGWSRSYDHYLNKFEQILNLDTNLIIFGDKELSDFVFSKRTEKNTQFILRDLNWFRNNQYFDLIQKIRVNPEWFNQVGWLKESTQAKLEMYNPLVMSKVFLLHDAKILDKFNSDYMFWIDAGLTNTVHSGYFSHDKITNKLSKYFHKFSFVCFPYEANKEIHGFDYERMNSMVNNKINKVARAGFFGGPKESISVINQIYYDLLMNTLRDGYMGTEESIFTLMTYLNSDIINYFEIESNGLLGVFFENLKNDNIIIKSENKLISNIELKIENVGLYVISFNSPSQFQTLLDSMIEYDENYILNPKKFLLDNSTDELTFDTYSEICKKYGFEHIKKNNLGICGGRQFIAEHFETTGLDYYLFFEDDMFFFPNEGTCRNGFKRYEKDLYSKSLEIISKENFDFLKLNYTEFFGDNGTQWSWYNVPQITREEFWPENPRLPVQGLDPNAPKTLYKNVLSHKGVPYVNGEIYYSNWPQIVSKFGNKKMFLDTTWAHPYEQTWMSHMFQLTKKGELNPGLLLMTPTEHNRFEHYDRELRKES